MYYNGIPFSEAKIVAIISSTISISKFKCWYRKWFDFISQINSEENSTCIRECTTYLHTYYLYYYKDFHPTLISIRARIMNWTGQTIIIPRYSEFWGYGLVHLFYCGESGKHFMVIFPHMSNLYQYTRSEAAKKKPSINMVPFILSSLVWNDEKFLTEFPQMQNKKANLTLRGSTYFFVPKGSGGGTIMPPLK